MSKSTTLDMSLVKVVLGGNTLKNLTEVQRTDDGEKATLSDPDVNGNVVVYLKKNNVAEFDVTTLNGSDDADLLDSYYKNGRVFTFTYSDKRKNGVTKGGSGNNAMIMKAPGNGLEDDPTYTITITDYQMK